MNINDLPKFKCHQVVRAAKIRSMGRGSAEDSVFLEGEFDNCCMLLPNGWIRKHAAERGGYLVVYEDGHLSYSPEAAFEAGYHQLLTDDQGRVVTLHGKQWDADFSSALQWLKEGKRVQRAGWNGAGQWVSKFSPPAMRFFTFEDDSAYSLPPGFVLKNAQGELVQWGPSIGDLMATDWQVFAEQVASDIPPHQQRVYDEFGEVSDRLVKLEAFIAGGGVFEKLDPAEQRRLKAQSESMSDYRDILGERIAAF